MVGGTDIFYIDHQILFTHLGEITPKSETCQVLIFLVICCQDTDICLRLCGTHTAIQALGSEAHGTRKMCLWKVISGSGFNSGNISQFPRAAMPAPVMVVSEEHEEGAGSRHKQLNLVRDRAISLCLRIRCDFILMSSEFHPIDFLVTVFPTSDLLIK